MISSMCYGVIINQFKWFWKVQSYIRANKKNYSCILLKIKIVMTVYSYYVMYTFQREPTLYSCLNVKELLARNRHDILSLSNCNGTRTHNPQTVNHLSKLVKSLSSVVIDAFGYMFLSCHIRISEWIHIL